MAKFLFTAFIMASTIFIASFSIAQEDHPITDKHKDIGLTCENCHETSSPENRPAMAVCIECHKSYETIKELTKNLKPNPHDSHQGDLRCTLCHSAHGNDKLYCNECHELTDYKFK